MSLQSPSFHRHEIALAAGGLGVIEFDPVAQAVHLDAASIRHHVLTAAFDGWMALAAWLELFGPDDRPRLRALLAAGAHSAETERIFVHRPVPDQRAKRMLELGFRGSPTGGAIGFSRDVTKEHTTEEMRRQKLAAERASQSKTEFMSQVSHELRTPLNAILGFAQLMAMDQEIPLPGVHRDRLEVLQHSGRRLLGLIDQLLQIGKIEQGKRQLRIRSVHVGTVVGRCVDALHVMARERNIEVGVDIENVATASVRADADSLEQVLTNLLSNAIKYNRESGRVRIRYRVAETGLLTIDDTGNGLTESQLGRLFEPFNRLAARKTPIQGSGLGLVITRQLLQAMGGRLDVWSQVGKGSRFSVHLPLGRPVRQTVSETMPLELPSRWDTGVERSVLYIEDDEVNVALMGQVFSTQPDWRLYTATTGAEGISFARRQSPELILLDMNLPDMTGAEVFDHLKADRRTRDIPCVAVSADALPEQIARAHSAGLEDYWTKPLDLPATIGKLKRLLR